MQMSQSYLDLPETNFPQAIDTFDRAMDVTIDLLPLVQRYQNLYNSGKINEASQLLIDNPQLQSCMINAKTINRCYDGIKALQRYYFSDIQKYIEQLITYKGEYSSKTSYEKYDVCLYNGSAYLCISDSGIGILPTSDKWVRITLQGEQGVPGFGLNYSGAWSATKTYPKDSCVTYNNCLYASIYEGDNIGKTPGQNSEYWSLVFDISLFTVYDNSSSNLNSTSLQSAIDEVNLKVNSNTNKLNTVENGAQKNTITGIKGSSESNYRTGNVNITPANLGITVINNTADKDKSVATANNANSVNGFKFSVGTTELEAGVSTLTTNTFYFVYE
jgi:hypothetical protein